MQKVFEKLLIFSNFAVLLNQMNMGSFESNIITELDAVDESPNAFLSKHTLNQLANRVCMKMVYLKELDPDTMWAEVSKYCKDIERNEAVVDSIVISCKKKGNRYFGDYKTPRLYCINLTLVYILLYYRHHDEDLYKKGIFNTLYDSMGIFGSSQLTILNKLIDQVIEFNQLLNSEKKESPCQVVFTDPYDQQRFEEMGKKIKEASKEMKDSEIAALKKENAELKELLAELQNEDGKDSAKDIPHDKVRPDLLFRLLKIDNSILDVHGNKIKAAILMRKICGLPLKTCQNYCTDQNLNPDAHPKEVAEVNDLLSSLELDISLPMPTKEDAPEG